MVDKRAALPAAVLTVFLSIFPLPAGAAAAQETAGSEAGSEPTAEEILARHLEARGGKEAWEKIRSLRITGTYTAFSEEAPFTLLRRRPAAYRFDSAMLSTEYTETYDGEAGWVIDPLAGLPWAVPMNGAQLALAAADARFDSPLMDAAVGGDPVELVGRSDFDGIETWALKVTPPGGGEETWYLDAETWLQVGRVAPAVDFGSPVGSQRVFYDDHREVAGVRFPFYIETDFFIRHRSWAVDAIEVNPELTPGVFRRPPPAGMEALAPLAGDWQVRVERRPSPRAPWAESSATAILTPRLGGTLLAEHLSLELDGRPVEMERTLSYDRFRERYRLTQSDSLTGLTGVFEGVLEEGALRLSDVETGTPLVLGGQTLYGRQTFSEITPEGFRVEWEISTDGGENWFANTRLTYHREDGAGNGP